jgi:catechol 2,3-dioxygenase-like lactoylglutathione lyase family enzyme
MEIDGRSPPSLVTRAITHAAAGAMISLLAATTPAAQTAPSSAGAPVGAVTTGRIIGPALRSTDLARSTRFYQDGLGLSFAGRLDLPNVTELMFAFGSSRQPPVLIVFKGKDSASASPMAAPNAYGRTVLEVGDAQHVYDRLQTAGFQPDALHVNSTTGFKGFSVKDPDGHSFEVTQRPSIAGTASAN